MSAIAQLRVAMAATFAEFDAAAAFCRPAGPRLVCVDPAAVAVAPAPAGPTRPCAECAGLFSPTRPNKLFCSAECGRAFNNRRMVRGALVYDLFMTLRYDRERGKLRKVWRAMCRLAEGWRADDHAKRGGRRSWTDAGELLVLHPYLTAERGPRLRGGRS